MVKNCDYGSNFMVKLWTNFKILGIVGKVFLWLRDGSQGRAQ